MLGEFAVQPRNRDQPRIAVSTLCSEIDDEILRHAMVVDLSPEGLRIQRPLGGRRSRELQLEFEVPEVDEVIWARGEIRFDEVWRLPRAGADRLSGVVRTSGIRLVSVAQRHRRLLREYVIETWHQTMAPITDGWLSQASCYMRG